MAIRIFLDLLPTQIGSDEWQHFFYQARQFWQDSPEKLVREQVLRHADGPRLVLRIPAERDRSFQPKVTGYSD